MGIPVATITDQQGQKLGLAFELLSLEVRRELNRIPEATLKFLDGSVAKRAFELSNQSFFEPGKQVSIALRYEGEGADTVVFDGLIVRHEVDSDINGSSLRVELKDRAFKLTRQRKSTIFRKQTDDEALRKLISDAQLDTGSIATQTTKFDELVQYYATDWDFLVSRADVEGMVVRVDRGTISVEPMFTAGKKPKARLDFGITEGLEFELSLDGTDQWAAMSSS
ncbi:MAG TPA: contractile injection system protein, VgrG/Pvc8 family, partial [Polyangiaceae bacterium]|nr:contractile injection system protein, VgrG/Pvc8 family [Polyangiaceae bacterium]